MNWKVAFGQLFGTVGIMAIINAATALKGDHPVISLIVVFLVSALIAYLIGEWLRGSK